MSGESEPVQIGNGGWPLWLILAVASGAFAISVTIAALAFVYYYKRHVETYQGVYQTLLKLLHAPLNNTSEQDSCRPVAPALPIPNLPSPQNTDPNTTVYQTISGTPDPSYTPSLQNLEANNLANQYSGKSSLTLRDSLGYKLLPL
uniref:Uncharacterized protein n=1 Tax=Plectus sambesii TaxID=2011161 RepID=A0A914V481_9BILA